ncbi:MAG: cation:proton antiporter [Acidobacteriota bacterium]
MHVEIVLLLLFAVATAVALLTIRLKVPYTVALVVAGLGLGSLHLIEPIHLTQELLYAVILPGLLFEAAFHLNFHDFWQNRMAISSLAIIGVVVSILVTASILYSFTGIVAVLHGLPFSTALVFGAIVAASDPIAVVALFKSVGAPKRLRVLVEGESLLNDGTSLVLFTLIVASVGGGAISIPAVIQDFIRIVGLGLMVGTLCGVVISWVISRVDHPMIEITLTTLAAYGSFVSAELVHGSGVIAAVAAGMVCGNYGVRTGMSPTTRIAVETFWEYAAFALNSIVFLLIGFEVRIGSLFDLWLPILVAYLAMTAARMLLVGVISLLLRPTRESIPWSWSGVMVWAGMRGALSMVLVLGLSNSFASRELLVTITFGVVVLTILLQGLTMAPLLRVLGIASGGEERFDYEVGRGALVAIRSAMKEIDRMSHEFAVPPGILETLRYEYQQRQQEAEEKIQRMHVEKEAIREEELEAARRHLLLSEKHALIEDLRTGYIGQDAYEELLREVDSRLLHLEETPEERQESASRPGHRHHSEDD